MAFVSAILWGVWWIPIRWLNTQGVDGAWGSISMNVGAALAVLVWLAVRRIPLRLGARAVAGAALVGVAVATYSIALTLSDVVRVILLFYLAPAWSKIIEWLFLGARWGWASSFTLAASVSGAFLVLGGEVSLANFGAGDVLAVLSGMAWAVGATLIFTGKPANAVALSLATALSAIMVGLGFVWLGAGSLFTGELTLPGVSGGAGLGAVYVLPILVLTLWSAQRLTPAVISFLLTAEILSGVLSGVILLDEAFGPLQALGACLILLAAAGEVVPYLTRRMG